MAAAEIAQHSRPARTPDDLPVPRAVDAIVSYHHLRVRKGNAPASLSLGQFCGEVLGDWCEHVQLGLEQRAAFPERTLFVAYEQMKSDAAGALRRVLDFLGWEAAEAQITAAVEACDFEQLRAREQQRKPQIAEKQFFRKGRIGGGAEELGPEFLARIERVARAIYENARECVGSSVRGTVPSDPISRSEA